MSFISEISASAPPIHNVRWERREFPSPDHLWLAIFHDPSEWRMGANEWQLSVISSKSSLAATKSAFAKLPNNKGLAYPLHYVPWSADSKVLALCFWEDGLVYFEPLSNVYRAQNVFPEIIQWSPTSNYLLIFLSKGSQFELLDDAGNIITRLDWKTAESEFPSVGWMPSGKIFFVISRSSKRAKSRIAFIDAEHGTILSNELLDPEKFVPYNHNEYKGIPRGRYSLVETPSSRAVGYLLDKWVDVIYQRDKGIIFLSTYRPVSKVFELNGYPACQVEKKWVSIKLYS